MFLDLQEKTNMALKRVKNNLASKNNIKKSLTHRIGEAGARHCGNNKQIQRIYGPRQEVFREIRNHLK